MMKKAEEISQHGIKTFRNIQMAAKVELILKPEYMNTVYTWHQIKEAILSTDVPTNRKCGDCKCEDPADYFINGTGRMKENDELNEKFLNSGKSVMAVYKFDNGNVAAFSWDEEQIPFLQGQYSNELRRKIMEHSDTSTRWYGFN